MRTATSPPGDRLSIWRRPVTMAMLAPWVAFLFPLLVYNAGFRFQGGGDSTPAELLPISLFRDGDFDFREFVSGDLPYWYRLVQGRVVSNYPVLPGLLNVPIYAAARIAHVDLEKRRLFLSGINASVISALSVLFLYLALTHVSRSKEEALFFALAFAFARRSGASRAGRCSSTVPPCFFSPLPSGRFCAAAPPSSGPAWRWA